jgi:hypothetical protein
VVLKSNKKDLPSGAELLDGEVVQLDNGEYLESLQLMPSALPEFQSQIDNWFVNLQRDQSAYPGVTGEEPKASTPFQSLQASQTGSIFNKRRDQDGFFILEVLLDWVLPFVIKQINKDHLLTAAYSNSELEQLDQAIVEDHSNNAARESILSGKVMLPEHKAALALDKQMELQKNGAKRTLYIPKGFITLAKVKQKVRFDITDEMHDNQRELNSLATTLQSMAPTDPGRTAIIQQMMEISGSSPASYSLGAAAPAPTGTPSPTQPSRTIRSLPRSPLPSRATSFSRLPVTATAQCQTATWASWETTARSCPTTRITACGTSTSL